MQNNRLYMNQKPSEIYKIFFSNGWNQALEYDHAFQNQTSEADIWLLLGLGDGEVFNAIVSCRE